MVSSYGASLMSTIIPILKRNAQSINGSVALHAWCTRRIHSTPAYNNEHRAVMIRPTVHC